MKGGNAMAVVKVKIEPVIINWILQTIEFSHVSSSILETLNKWKSGEKEPTFNQVQKLSKQINIPLGYFFLQTPPQEEHKLVEYRTVDSLNLQNPSRNLIDTIDSMTNIQDWMRDHLVNGGYDKLKFVGSDRANTDIMEIARHIREALQLEIEWYVKSSSPMESYKILRSHFEEIGILVMMNGIVCQNTRRPLDVKEFRAFTLIDEYAPLIFINTQDSEGGKLFSLLHEVTHIWLGVSSLYNDQFGTTALVNDIERVCNAVSAEILVPLHVFSKIWDNQTNYHSQIDSLVRVFRCSKSVIARRALDVGFISGEQYTEVVEASIQQYEEMLQAKNAQKSSGGNYYNTMSSRIDHRFLRALASSAQAGKTQYTEVYRLTNTNRSTFERLIKEVGGGATW